MIHGIEFTARSKQFFTSLVGGTASLLALMMSSSSALAGTDIDWNELKNGSGPVVFLVNGFGGCDPCIAGTLHDKLKDNGIPVYDLDWNDIYRRTQQSNFNLNDAQFLQQMESVINSVPESRPIVLIGHSFGGDSSLKVAQRTSRHIELLGVLDAVELGGIRTGRSVRSNVGYFYNRWTSNPSRLIPGIPGIPLNPKKSGAVSCNAKTCDQKEQSFGFQADGKARRVACGSLEVSCTGYNPLPGGSNGTKHLRRTHGGTDAIYKDQLIQEQLFQKILQIKRDSRPVLHSTVRTRLPNLSSNNIKNTSQYIGIDDNRKPLWDWTIYIDSDQGTLSQIECVQYTLHPTFTDPIQKICDNSQFAFSAQGWGTFMVGVKILFKNGTSQELSHQLVFQEVDKMNGTGSKIMTK